MVGTKQKPGQQLALDLMTAGEQAPTDLQRFADETFKISCVDLFCGAGGLTYGLNNGGINVVAGIDLDGSCKFPYEENNDAEFIHKSIEDVKAEDITTLLRGADFTMLAGCAPCQPFSTYTRGGERKARDWRLLNSFRELIGGVKPDVVTMENVPGLHRHDVFREFEAALEKWGYNVTLITQANCPEYGIPQHRKRLILVASRHGVVEPPCKTHAKGKFATVRHTIGELPKIIAGETDASDPLHTASKLSETNLKRIRASNPGGTWRDWPEELVAACHKRKTGKSYPSVYGRMEWDQPSPTITTQSFGFGNGRFGHPEQDRGLSLREAAMLQTFPKDYKFLKPEDRIRFKALGRLIGNAVPPGLGKAIAMSIRQHLRSLR